jgi:hypothetical protein
MQQLLTAYTATCAAAVTVCSVEIRDGVTELYLTWVEVLNL